MVTATQLRGHHAQLETDLPFSACDLRNTVDRRVAALTSCSEGRAPRGVNTKRECPMTVADIILFLAAQLYSKGGYGADDLETDDDDENEEDNNEDADIEVVDDDTSESSSEKLKNRFKTLSFRQNFLHPYGLIHLIFFILFRVRVQST